MVDKTYNESQFIALFSSMFFNEDGDLAHEFYEEVKSRKKKRSKMKRVDSRFLQPQVIVLIMKAHKLWFWNLNNWKNINTKVERKSQYHSD